MPPAPSLTRSQDFELAAFCRGQRQGRHCTWEIAPPSGLTNPYPLVDSWVMFTTTPVSITGTTGRSPKMRCRYSPGSVAFVKEWDESTRLLWGRRVGPADGNCVADAITGNPNSSTSSLVSAVFGAGARWFSADAGGEEGILPICTPKTRHAMRVPLNRWTCICNKADQMVTNLQHYESRHLFRESLKRKLLFKCVKLVFKFCVHPHSGLQP